MKNPVEKSDVFPPAFQEKILSETKLKDRNVLDHFDSDLHNDDSVMMAEIYGGEFRKVWQKTHKKWWV
jgi:hypothetical protein